MRTEIGRVKLSKALHTYLDIKFFGTHQKALYAIKAVGSFRYLNMFGLLYLINLSMTQDICGHSQTWELSMIVGIRHLYS